MWLFFSVDGRGVVVGGWLCGVGGVFGDSVLCCQSNFVVKLLLLLQLLLLLLVQQASSSVREAVMKDECSLEQRNSLGEAQFSIEGAIKP